MIDAASLPVGTEGSAVVPVEVAGFLPSPVPVDVVFGVED